MSKKFGRFAVCALLVMVVSSLCGCSAGEAKAKDDKPDFSNAGYICKLSTLKVYYHNVAQASEDSNGLLFGIGQIGYKRMWFEYSGTVEVGIDVSKVQISQPDSDGVVTIALPEAEIQKVQLDEDSLTDPVIETGWFTSFTTEEKTKALDEAQKAMSESANKDETLKFQARQRAREMLKSYVQNVGELLGKEYTVEWIDE